MRTASSSVVRGSISRRTDRPLTLSVTGTGPGPTALTASCAAMSGAFARTAPAATPPAPTVLRKLRRENPDSSLRLDIGTSRRAKSYNDLGWAGLHLAGARTTGGARRGRAALVLVQRKRPRARQQQTQERPDQDEVVFDPVSSSGRQGPVEEEPVSIVHLPHGDPHVHEERGGHP